MFWRDMRNMNEGMKCQGKMKFNKMENQKWPNFVEERVKRNNMFWQNVTYIYLNLLKYEPNITKYHKK